MLTSVDVTSPLNCEREVGMGDVMQGRSRGEAPIRFEQSQIWKSSRQHSPQESSLPGCSSVC